MTCHEIVVNVHDLSESDVVDLMVLIGGLAPAGTRPFLSRRVCGEGCLHCRPAREDLHPLPAFRKAVLDGFVAEHSDGGVLDINAGEGP